MQTRIYKVIENTTNGQEAKLVEASSQSTAIRHVVGQRFTAEVVGAKEIASLMRTGVEVENAAMEIIAQSSAQMPSHKNISATL